MLVWTQIWEKLLLSTRRSQKKGILLLFGDRNWQYSRFKKVNLPYFPALPTTQNKVVLTFVIRLLHSMN